MTFNKCIFIFIIGTLIKSQVLATPSISLNDIILNMLNHNQEIRIKQKELSIANNQSSFVYADFLPSIDLILTNSSDKTDSNGSYSTGVAYDQKNATSSNDGFNFTITQHFQYLLGSFHLYQKNKRSYHLNELEYKLFLENKIINAINCYYDILRIEENLKILQTNYQSSKERYDKINKEYSIGAKTKLDRSVSKSIMNTDHIAVKIEQNRLNAQKRELAYIAGLKDNAFELTDSILINSELTFDKLQSKINKKNTTVKVSLQSKKINTKELHLILDEFLPSFTISYGWSDTSTESDTGFIKNNTSRGSSNSFQVSWRVFDGGKRIIKVKSARLAADVIQKKLDESIALTEKELQHTFDAYELEKSLQDIYKQNISLTKLNKKNAEDLYHFGQLSITDLRDIQVEHLKAKQLLNNSKFTTRRIECQLLKLSGELIELF